MSLHPPVTVTYDQDRGLDTRSRENQAFFPYENFIEYGNFKLMDSSHPGMLWRVIRLRYKRDPAPEARGEETLKPFLKGYMAAMTSFSLDTQPLWVILLVRIGGAILVLLVGRWLAGFLQSSVRSVMKRSRATPSLTEILARGTYYGIQVLAVSLALIILGIPANVLLGTLGIIVVVAAVALRESLRDLAATVNFIVFQPFKVGDIIQTNGVTGKVQEILLFTTVMVSPDNKQIILPNGNIQSSTLVNLTALDKVRIDLSVRLSYADGVQQVKDILVALAKADPRVLETPAPFVQVMELGDSQVEYVLRAYTSPIDAILVRPALNEQVKSWMEERKLSVPLSQIQVHGSPTMQISSVAPLAGNGQSQ
jgi:small conductance mechanosensitive channel